MVNTRAERGQPIARKHEKRVETSRAETKIIEKQVRHTERTRLLNKLSNVEIGLFQDFNNRGESPV